MTERKKRPTLQDVADRVGVTKMTVSRYLKKPEQVSAPLRARIQQALDALGYIPNKVPDILSSSRSQAIGLLVPSLTNQVFAELIRGVESVTEPAGYQTMLAHYGYSPQAEEARIATLLGYSVDGLILSESVHTERVRRMIETAGVPVVEVMDSVSPAIEQAIGFDNEAASFAMTERMIERGHRRIVYFAARMDARTRLKIHGYERAMRAHGLEPRSLRTERASSFTRGALLLGQALERWPEVDGVFCTNDDLAIGALFECQRRGIAVPDRIGIAGFHGHDIAAVVVPRLATVITPREEMGRRAADSLLRRLRGEPAGPPVVTLPFRIDEGGSLRPAS
ncbi:gluconate operon transcriptional repressor GntR [Marinobacter lutaoensis]|uniref:gluconate operon transcriptional repressor GntR n=1 Tax=Marinobacter lutaoensis TaxID=135739 RepID=UPI0015940D03|nr:gluconate operon transcriptional repressor GntR [Marinobacter lutaoensis]NVD34219.1 gluconate operon transcriptional repressor GntR [Marinobacter lutaoensis]